MLNRILGTENPQYFTKIYCSCGRLADIDRMACKVKKSLHKDLECARCRNLRIAREIELLDESPDAESGEIYI